MIPLPVLVSAPFTPEELTMLAETFKSDTAVPRATLKMEG